MRFITLGGWVDNNISAHKVRVKTVSGEYIPALIASKPPHFLSESERNSSVNANNLVVDVGASSAEEAINEYG